MIGPGSDNNFKDLFLYDIFSAAIMTAHFSQLYQLCGNFAPFVAPLKRRILTSLPFSMPLMQVMPQKWTTKLEEATTQWNKLEKRLPVNLSETKKKWGNGSRIIKTGEKMGREVQGSSGLLERKRLMEGREETSMM